MQSLKGLVIALGILIAASFGLLLYGFMTRLGSLKSSDSEPAAAVAESREPKAPRTVSLDLPGDCRLVDVMANDGHLVLRTGPVGACERVLVFDLATGRTIAEISVGPRTP